MIFGMRKTMVKTDLQEKIAQQLWNKISTTKTESQINSLASILISFKYE